MTLFTVLDPDQLMYRFQGAKPELLKVERIPFMKERKKMYYKLTDQDMKTYNNFQWELGEWYEIPEENQGKGLCSESWFHCYTHPLLAILLNPIDANIDNPKLFEIEVGGRSSNDGLKVGFTKMKLMKEIIVPGITTEQRVKFAILCALEVYSDEDFVIWARGWLSGENTVAEAARAAWATEAAAETAFWATEANLVELAERAMR